MLTQEPAAERTGAALPAWAQPPTTGPGDEARGARSIVRGVALRVLGAGGVALVLFLLGHRLGAAILLSVLGLSSALSLTVPAVGRGIDRFIAGFQLLVGRVLSVVLLGLVHLVVFVPVSVVLRLLGRDPLALGARPDDPTFWRGAARRTGKPLYKRPFAYERHPAVDRATRRVGLLPVLGCLVVVGLVDLGIGRLTGVGDQTATGPPKASAFQIPRMDAVAADDNEPWADQLFDELSANYQGMHYHPFRSLQMPDTSSEYVNVADGVRRSYEQRLTGAGEPIDVLFLGGSTVMGWFQRDEHTIASELARLAEADGIPVRVVNRGTPAYNNWQENLLLEELVTAGDTPDLALFYDGMNEIGAQFRSPSENDRPTHMHASDAERILIESSDTGDGEAGEDDRSPLSRMVDAYSSQSAIGEVVRRVRGTDDGDADGSDEDEPATFFVPWPAQGDQPAASGEIAAELHGRGVEAAEALAEHYGFRTAFFWQPSVFSKPELAGEETARGSWGTDPNAWTTASESARANLHDSVVDLSDVFDDVEDPVMYDYVHTNELGAKIIAQALYDRLKPALLEIQGADR